MPRSRSRSRGGGSGHHPVVAATAVVEVGSGGRALRLRSLARGREGKTVGIVGLSVGRTIALALAMERIVGKLHIADADSIELSNLNRMSCSLFELGAPKWASTARAIAEIDPYLEVEVWPGQRGK